MHAIPESSDLPILFDDVHVRAGQTTLLQGVSLSLHAGAPTVLIGPNGSGKTTLLRAAMGLVRPSLGRVLWGSTSGTSPARGALVFQRPVMLRRSVMQNLR